MWKSVVVLDEDLAEIVLKLRAHGADDADVEAKRAERKLPRSVRSTLSAFANTAGGVIILGLDEEGGFASSGVADAAKLESDLASVCTTDFEPPLRPRIRTHRFEGVDLVVAPSPDVLRNHVLDADDEDVLVVRPVEYTDPTFGGSALVVPPKEVVVGLLGARGLEGRYPTSLRVDAAEDMLDGAVFPSRIHGLQHDQQSPLILRVETLLEVLYAPALLLQLPGDVFFLPVLLGLVGIYRS
jgi:plasmid stabilization system protein ParE